MKHVSANEIITRVKACVRDRRAVDDLRTRMMKTSSRAVTARLSVQVGKILWNRLRLDGTARWSRWCNECGWEKDAAFFLECFYRSDEGRAILPPHRHRN